MMNVIALSIEEHSRSTNKFYVIVEELCNNY